MEPTPYSTLLREVRNLILKYRTTPEEFAAFLKELSDDPKKLGELFYKLNSEPWLNREEIKKADEETKEMQKKKSLMGLLWGMGVYTSGIAVGDEEAMGSVLELKKRFNFETNSFE